MGDGGDNKATYVAEGFVKITVNKVLCTRLPPNPCERDGQCTGSGWEPPHMHIMVSRVWAHWCWVPTPVSLSGTCIKSALI